MNDSANLSIRPLLFCQAAGEVTKEQARKLAESLRSLSEQAGFDVRLQSSPSDQHPAPDPSLLIQALEKSAHAQQATAAAINRQTEALWAMLSDDRAQEDDDPTATLNSPR